MDIVALLGGGILQCVLGSACIASFPSRRAWMTEPGAVAWLLGAGILVGALLTTLLLRVLSLVGIPFGPWQFIAPVVVLSALLGIMAKRNLGNTATFQMRNILRVVGGAGLGTAGRLLWLALLGWLVLRYSMLLLEVVTRPLYPWDAWTQWATKARVWYELGSMVPFVPAEAWFTRPDAGYIDAGPHYPSTVPLLMVWATTLLGRWDDALMNFPFWLLAVGFTLAAYGFLRQEGLSAPGALTGTWIASTLPLANVHVALAGYADLPLALYFALAVLAGYRWSRTREWADAVVALACAAACPLIKIPGIVWLAVLLPGLVLVLAPRLGLRIVMAGFAVGAVALLALAQTTPRVLGYALHLDFAPEWAALGNSYFMFSNWNLLWYGAIAAAVLARRQVFAPPLAALTVVILAGLFFLFVVFGFTNARDWVSDQTTVNRATLHLAPLMAIWMLLAFRAWAQARESQGPAVDSPA